MARVAARSLALLPEVVAAIAAGLLPVIVGIGVVARYTGLFTAAWTDEVAALLFLALAFLGAALGVKENAHFRFTVIVDLLPSLTRYFELANQLALAALGIMFVILGLELVELAGTATTPILDLPVAGTLVVVPLSGGLMTIYALMRAWMALRGTRVPRTEDALPLRVDLGI